MRKVILWSLLLASCGQVQAEHFCYYLVKDGELISFREPPYSLEYPPREPMNAEERRIREEMGGLIVALTDVPCENKTEILDTGKSNLKRSNKAKAQDAIPAQPVAPPSQRAEVPIAQDKTEVIVGATGSIPKSPSSKSSLKLPFGLGDSLQKIAPGSGPARATPIR